MAGREVPELVMKVMLKKRGQAPTFFAEKTLTESDTTQRQNRFLFHEDDVTNYIRPILSEAEKIRANLELGDNGMDDTEGLPVELYCMNEFMSNLFLRRRESKGLVLKGKELKNARVFGKLRVGEHVQLWSFRKPEDGSLCLVIIKI